MEPVTNNEQSGESNAHNQDDLQNAEAQQRQLAHENAVLAEIGRIIGSSLDIDQVYERFAEQTRKLIDFDITSISLLASEGEFVDAYTSELIVPSRPAGELIPLEGSGTGLTLKRSEPSTAQTRWPAL